MAKMTLPMLAWVSAISAIASRTGGIDISPSMMRMTIASAQRLKPVTRPMARPSAVLSNATREPDHERHARAVERAAVDVAAEHVGAEPVCRRRRAQPLRSATPPAGRRCRDRAPRSPSAPSASSTTTPTMTVGCRRHGVAQAARRRASGRERDDRRRDGVIVSTSCADRASV